MHKIVESLNVQFRDVLISSGLIDQGSTGLLAVSGGLDSVVMAHLFSQVRDQLGLALGVAHFNHALRGAASDADEQFVNKLAAACNMPFFADRWEPRWEDNLEERAREARYGFLERVSEEHGYDWIATAHHADDQAETILMRLIKGGGFRGLMGIPERNGKVVRPLLRFTKSELKEYAAENSSTYREDSSNHDDRFDRNRIRQHILPQIERMSPRFAQTVQRTASTMKELSDWLDHDVRQVYAKTVSMTPEGFIQIDEGELGKVPPLLQKELARAVVDSGETLWRGHVWDDLHRFLSTSSVGDILDLPGGQRILKDRDRFLVAEAGWDNELESYELHFTAPISQRVGHHLFRLDVCPPSSSFRSAGETEFIDAAKLYPEALHLRPWQAGDRMVPLGMNGSKKVSDILVDAKIDRFAKMSQYVLTSGEKIVWLCGLRLDDAFKVTPSTSSVARLNWTTVAQGNTK